MKRLVLLNIPAWISAMRKNANCAVVLLVLAIVTAGCTKTIPVNDENGDDPQVSNVNFTACQQTKVKSAEISGCVDVAFNNEGVQITYTDFEVTCDFTAVDVTFTFENGFLNITQKGSPNQAKCVCYTDVSYTINGISRNKVNVIFINGVQVYCYNNHEDCSENAHLKIGEVIEIKSGETVCNAQYGLSLRGEIINDSRCPIGVECYWEGNASVQFHLATKKSEYIFTLDTHRGPAFKNDTVIEGIKYQLRNVLPYPVFGEEQPIKTVRILVDKKDDGGDDDDNNWTNNTVELRKHNKNKISITEGVWGTLVKTEGNCMPPVVNSWCKQFPVRREIVVYEYTTFNETTQSTIWSVFFDTVNTKLIATTSSDKEGFFQLELKPGKYSVFVKEQQFFWANSYDGYGGISPVIVEMSNISEKYLDMNYDAAY